VAGDRTAMILNAVESRKQYACHRPAKESAGVLPEYLRECEASRLLPTRQSSGGTQVAIRLAMFALRGRLIARRGCLIGDRTNWKVVSVCHGRAD
jgi:hypothetical protein